LSSGKTASIDCTEAACVKPALFIVNVEKKFPTFFVWLTLEFIQVKNFYSSITFQVNLKCKFSKEKMSNHVKYQRSTVNIRKLDRPVLSNSILVRMPNGPVFEQSRLAIRKPDTTSGFHMVSLDRFGMNFFIY
jgi:hypothetical protein